MLVLRSVVSLLFPLPSLAVAPIELQATHLKLHPTATNKDTRSSSPPCPLSATSVISMGGAQSVYNAIRRRSNRCNSWRGRSRWAIYLRLLDFNSSAKVKEAIALGLLDPKVEYDFAHISNGTLRKLAVESHILLLKRIVQNA